MFTVKDAWGYTWVHSTADDSESLMSSQHAQIEETCNPSATPVQNAAPSQHSGVRYNASPNNARAAVNSTPLASYASPTEDDVVQGQASELSDEDWLHNVDISANQNLPYSSVELELFLMRHYTNRVCHLFCALDTAKSPWKTIHLPRALQSMSEFSVTGKTSRIRKALQKALLSVSAWYLSNDHGRHDATDAADSWARIAAMYGFDAIALLKQAVEFDLYRAPRPKYKEFLATMLSMVTVNVSKLPLART